MNVNLWLIQAQMWGVSAECLDKCDGQTGKYSIGACGVLCPTQATCSSAFWAVAMDCQEGKSKIRRQKSSGWPKGHLNLNHLEILSNTLSIFSGIPKDWGEPMWGPCFYWRCGNSGSLCDLSKVTWPSGTAGRWAQCSALSSGQEYI